jgi:hypothetical protein
MSVTATMVTSLGPSLLFSGIFCYEGVLGNFVSAHYQVPSYFLTEEEHLTTSAPLIPLFKSIAFPQSKNDGWNRSHHGVS